MRNKLHVGGIIGEGRYLFFFLLLIHGTLSVRAIVSYLSLRVEGRIFFK